MFMEHKGRLEACATGFQCVKAAIHGSKVDEVLALLSRRLSNFSGFVAAGDNSLRNGFVSIRFNETTDSAQFPQKQAHFFCIEKRAKASTMFALWQRAVLCRIFV